MLEKFNISLDLGDSKNKNSCAIVDKAIQELEMELKRLNPENNKLEETTLLIATHHLNSKLRPSKDNLSSKEILLMRDQFTGEQLDISDGKIIKAQHDRRVKSHGVGIKVVIGKSDFEKGDLVLLKGEGNKHQARDTYIVCGMGPIDRPNTLKIRKMLHMLGEAGAGKIMKQTYLVKPSQLIKFLNTASITSSADSSDSELFTSSSSGFDDEQPAWTKCNTKEAYLSSSEDDVQFLARKQIQPSSIPSPCSSSTSPAWPESRPSSPAPPLSPSRRIDASPPVTSLPIFFPNMGKL